MDRFYFMYDPNEPDPEKRKQEEQERLDAWKATPEGMEFFEDLEESKRFFSRRCDEVIEIDELYFMSILHDNSLLNGALDLLAFAYKKGYDAGMAE